MPQIEVVINSDVALSQLGYAEVLEWYGEDALLKAIGKDKAMEYFNLTEKEEE